MSTKTHFTILDGLRGVAACMVVIFHLFEANAVSPLTQIINHGYLAVDFFFLLSGFVIGYAYDDRWGKLTIAGFFRKRLQRLQPMVVMGMFIGAVFFYFQASNLWPGIATVPFWKVILVMVIGFFMIPIPPSMDIRGWSETYPLNGPAWSLFYEYVVNIFYGLFVRRFSKFWLSVLVLVSGIALIHFSVTNHSGDLIGGWSLEPDQLRIGFTRVMYPFFAGLLLYRTSKLVFIKNAFFWCSLLLIILLSVPRIGGTLHVWENGLYESLTIVFLFPFIVFLGAGGSIQNKRTLQFCQWLGNISYPLYITHYPLIYWYTAWVHDHKVSNLQSLGMAIMVFFIAITIAFVALKWYDEPVRKWLQTRNALQE